MWLPVPRAGLAVEVSACAVASVNDAGDEVGAIGCGCREENDSGPLPDTGDWGRGSGTGGVTVKALPGTVCHMNVGNVLGGDGVKIDSCEHLEGRALEVADSDCDTISLIELMSDFQCGKVCEEDPDDEQCEVCRGCTGSTATLACERQAEVVCPPAKYEIACTQAPASSVGCDCLCRKKDICAAQGTECVDIPNLRVDDRTWTDQQNRVHHCSAGNYATCTLCTDPYGGPSMGSCAVHPDHCNNGKIDSDGDGDIDHDDDGVSFDEVDRARCLAVCSTGLLELAADKIKNAEIRTMSGDFNCTPQGEPCDGFGVSIAECPWLDGANTFRGMEVCYQPDNTASVGYRGCLGGTPLGSGCANCMLDFVMSTHCGCGETWAVMDGIAYGDHRTIRFGMTTQPVIRTVPGTSHRLVHGNSTVRRSDGSTFQQPYSSEQFEGPLGLSCRAAASCGSSVSGGTVVAHTEVCEARHQARVWQTSGCLLPGKAMVCGSAWAWGWASGQASGHGAETADAAEANATGSGNRWQTRCEKQRHIVDLRRVGVEVAASDPLLFLSNADATCTLRAPSGTPKPIPGTTTSTD